MVVWHLVPGAQDALGRRSDSCGKGLTLFPFRTLIAGCLL